MPRREINFDAQPAVQPLTRVVKHRRTKGKKGISMADGKSGKVTSVPLSSVAGVMLGIAAVVVAVLIAVPAAVTLPLSWMAALLAVILGVIGVVLIKVHLGRLTRKQASPEGK